MIIDDNGTKYEVDATREELEAALRKVGLISDAEETWDSLSEFLEMNDVRIYEKEAPPEKITVEKLAKWWS